MRSGAGTGCCSPTTGGSPDPAAAAAYVAARTDTLQLLLAHRPNLSYPTYAAKVFATIDQISGGRVAVHFITGGGDAEQGREGDFLTKDQRYDRTREYIGIVKKAWTSHEPFSHQGTHYDFGRLGVIAGRVAASGSLWDPFRCVGLKKFRWPI